MITTRTAKQCGQADFGWLQARYTFSFGHYFDPKLLGFASLRVLNQEVLAPGASFQARTYPKVDILNLILEGEAEYRDSDGNHVQAKAGEALLIATPLQQKTEVVSAPLQLLASPEGENGSLQLRQQAWVYHIALEKGEQISVQLHGPRAYLQSIHGTVHAVAQEQQKQALTCGDGAFIRDEANITLVADTPLRALLIDLPV